MPILFLDLDDVLCLNTHYSGVDAVEATHNRHSNPTGVYRQLFSPGACAVLQRLHDTMDGRLRYVISSSWREFFGREHLCQVFRQGGLGFVADALHDADRWSTPTQLWRGRRVDEIAAWLDCHHRGEAFAVLDDTSSGASLQPALSLPGHPLHGRVVLCQENVGLCDEHLQTLVDALDRPASLPGNGESR